MTPEEILEKWQRDDSYVRKTGRRGTNHEEYSLSDEDLLDLIHRAQREAVEKTQDAMLKFIFSLGGSSMVDISEVTKAIFEITPEKVLLAKE